MEKSMRARNSVVTLLTNEYPPYVFGGGATFSKQVAEWLSSSGWRVFVVAGKAGIYERVSVEKINEKLTVMRVYFPGIPPRWLLYAVFSRNYLKMLLNRYKVIVLSNNLLTWLSIKCLKGFKNVTNVITVFHGSPYSLLTFFHHVTWDVLKEISLEELAYYVQAPLVNHLIRKDMFTSDRYVFVADHVVEEYESLFGDEVKDLRRRGVVVYPGVEFEDLVELRQKVGRARRGKIIIAYIGRLYYVKGVTQAVKAVEDLTERGYRKDVELWVFGKGPLEPWLEHYLKRRKLLKNVRLFGFVERSKLLSLMAKYVDVLLHPSLYEGAPLAVMEAQALGIPVVAYDLPWAREFIIDGVNGYKARYPDTAKLAEGVVKAARLNASAVMLSAEKYDRKRTLRKLESVLE